MRTKRFNSPAFLRLDDGLTLVEVVVATAILGIVMLVFTSTLASMQQAVVAEDVRSRLNDESRIALAEMDRQIRSGNILYNPSAETGNVAPFGVSAAGYLFRVYTQAKFSPIDDPRCAAWFVDNQRRLLYRWWPVLSPESATGWRVVATGIVNRDLSSPVFSLDAAGRTVTISLRANVDYVNDPSATQTFSSSLTGRNTSFGYPDEVCQQLPSDM